MTTEVDVLSEMYSIMKQYIPQKDRQEAADNVMSVMVDMLSDEQLKDFSVTDGALSRAFKEYASDIEDHSDGDVYDEYE